MANNAINKVIGAVALTGVSGALTRISSDILKVGDIGFVATNSIFYIYKCFESSVEATQEPYTTKNPPYFLKPDDADDLDSSFRWHLISSSFFTQDIIMKLGTFFQTSIIKGDDELSFKTGEDLEIAKIKSDGNFWVKELTTESRKLVENLNSEFVKGVHGDLIMTRDGNRRFYAPVAGEEPIEADHLATKNYVDEKLNLIDPSSFMKKDGSTSFTGPVAGISPYKDEHLATKKYVDDKVKKALEELDNQQNYLIYKVGKKEINVNTSKLTITFGGVLKSYTVFTTVVNTSTDNPYSLTATIVKQTNTSFTVDFGGTIDTTGYYLNYLIVGMPLELLEDI